MTLRRNIWVRSSSLMLRLVTDAGVSHVPMADVPASVRSAWRTSFEALWGANLDAKPGLTVVEIMDAVHAGKISGMYIMGENPAMSDPDAGHAREALAALERAISRQSFGVAPISEQVVADQQAVADMKRRPHRQGTRRPLSRRAITLSA